MGFHIRNREAVPSAIRRIAVEEFRSSIDDVRLRQPDTHEAVHDFRKRCKKLRGLLRLVRPHLGDQFAQENAFLRDLSRDLSFVRDAQALLEALDRLVKHYHAEVQPGDFDLVYQHFVESRDSVAGGEDHLVAKLEGMIGPLTDATQRASDWNISADGFDAVEAGLLKTYRRTRKAMEMAYQHPSTHNFHEWRKRVKYHWHHSLLLRRICTRFMKPHRRLAELLGELLGQDHDYAVLRERLTDIHNGARLDEQKLRLVQLIERRQAELRVEMAHYGGFLQAERPGQLAARWRAYWNNWRDEARP